MALLCRILDPTFLKSCFRSDRSNLCFTSASLVGKVSFAKLYSSVAMLFFNTNFAVENTGTGDFSTSILTGSAATLLAGTLQMFNVEMITSTAITEHVIKCLLVISFFIICTTFGRMRRKGMLYRSDYQILSIFRLLKKMVFGSKTAFNGFKQSFWP